MIVTPALQAVGVSAAPQGSPSAPPPGDDLGREAFLQLLVTQIRVQDPLNPLQPTEFVTQLAQFSELEQMIGIRRTLEGIAEAGGEVQE